MQNITKSVRKTAIPMLLAAALALAGAATAPAQQKSKAEREAEKQERRAAERAERRAERMEEIRRDLEGRTDLQALALLKGASTDPLLAGYITSLGQSLVPDDVPTDVQFSFRVLNHPEPNAFALYDGRIFITTGMLAFAESEAQVAMVLGHEIAHVTGDHVAERIYNSMYGAAGTAGRILSSAGRIAGMLGGGGSAGGTSAAGDIMSIVNAFTSAKFGRDQERESDSVGIRMALAQGYDPTEGEALWKKMQDRFGDQSRFMAALSRHPGHGARAKAIRESLDGDLREDYEAKKAAGDLVGRGDGRFGRVTSSARRDASILLSEVLDRHDLALDQLEGLRDVRGDDPRLLWALGRIHRLTGRGEEAAETARGFLEAAIRADQRGLYPAIHRDLAYLHATASNDFAAATESIKAYVGGHVRKHGILPVDMDAVYDHLSLFGEPAWVPAETGAKIRAAEVWSSPAGPGTGALGGDILREAVRQSQSAFAEEGQK